jgi:hypothetical protein
MTVEKGRDISLVNLRSCVNQLILRLYMSARAVYQIKV